MKIDCITKDKYVIYISKYYYECNKDNIEKCLSKIFIRLKKLYDIEVHSIFNIKCYINNNYGTIFEIEKEYDPFSLYTKKTNANIKFFNDSKMLYEIPDYFINNSKKYLKNNKFYLDVIDDINIIEHINSIVYGNKACDIVDNN